MTTPLKYLNDKRMRVVHLLFLLAFYSFCVDRAILVLLIRVNYYYEKYVWYTSYKNGLLAPSQPNNEATGASTAATAAAAAAGDGGSGSGANGAAASRSRPRTRARPSEGGSHTNNNHTNSSNNNSAARSGRARRLGGGGGGGDAAAAAVYTSHTGEIAEDGDLLITKEMMPNTANDTERYEILNRSTYNRTLLHRPLLFSFLTYLLVVVYHVVDLRWYYLSAKPRGAVTAAADASTIHQYPLDFSNDVRFWKKYDTSGLLTSYLIRWDAHVGLFMLPSVLPFLDLLVLLVECLAATLFSEEQEAHLVDQYTTQQQQRLAQGNTMVNNTTTSTNGTDNELNMSSGSSSGGDGCFSWCGSLRRKVLGGWTSQLFVLLPDREEEMQSTILV